MLLGPILMLVPMMMAGVWLVLVLLVVGVSLAGMLVGDMLHMVVGRIVPVGSSVGLEGHGILVARLPLPVGPVLMVHGPVLGVLGMLVGVHGTGMPVHLNIGVHHMVMGILFIISGLVLVLR